MTKPLTIGRLAKIAGVGIETIRFYERQDLLTPPSRTNSGYRQYDRESLKRLAFIKNGRELGFSLREIKELLSLRVDHKSTRADVRRLVGEKVLIVQKKIAELKRIEWSLNHLLAHCREDGATDDCPILDAIEMKPLADIATVSAPAMHASDPCSDFDPKKIIQKHSAPKEGAS